MFGGRLECCTAAAAAAATATAVAEVAVTAAVVVMVRGVEIRPGGERLNLSRGGGRPSHPSGGADAGAPHGRNQPERVRDEIVCGARAHRSAAARPHHGRHVYCLAARRRGGLIVKLSDTAPPCTTI